ncbi:glycosyltransferase [soil metagenome]
MQQKKILILMSNTGGGHRASAEALKVGFAQCFGDRFRVDIIDLLMDYLPIPLNQLPKSYSFLANDATWLWKLLWESGDYPGLLQFLGEIVPRITEKSVRRVFRQFAPDLIISVHPLVHEIALRPLARMGRRIPFVTVVTDLASIHPLWLHPAVDACYVASDEAYQRALEAGLQPAQLHLFGLPVGPAFATPARPKAILRQELGMHPSLPATLVVGGGEGIGPVAEIAQHIARRLFSRGRAQGQLVIICGSNQRLREKLADQTWPIPTVINGFVNNMPEWMAACDCIITKAGPGTIAEALSRGLPIVLSGFIPGQEEGNVPYVVNNQVGVHCEDPAAIAKIVQRWFGSDQSTLQKMARNARQLGHPQATFQIVESIASLLNVSMVTDEQPEVRKALI